MAIPVFITEMTMEQQRNLLALVISSLYVIVVVLTLFGYPEKTETKTETETKTATKTATNTITPVKRSKIGRKCPNAPKPKRQRMDMSPVMSATLEPRKLFDDVAENVEHVEHVEHAVVSDVESFTVVSSKKNKQNKKVCPDAPLKKAKKQENKVDVSDVATKLSLRFADIRTKPSAGEKLSEETSNNIVAYSSDIVAHSGVKSLAYITLLSLISKEAQKYDITNPNRNKLSLTNEDIKNYLNSLVWMYGKVSCLNKNNIVLPHSGTGELTKNNDSNGKPYMLTDLLSNASFGITLINSQLVSILNQTYKKNKKTWSVVPQSYEMACRMCREIQIVSKMLHREISLNMNMTSWAEW
jgi:hypothetical protein